MQITIQNSNPTGAGRERKSGHTSSAMPIQPILSQINSGAAFFAFDADHPVQMKILKAKCNEGGSDVRCVSTYAIFRVYKTVEERSDEV
jgi:hypothetical protein